MRLVDIEEFHERHDSMELQTFQGLVMRHIETAKDKLLKKWVFQFFASLQPQTTFVLFCLPQNVKNNFC